MCVGDTPLPHCMQAGDTPLHRAACGYEKAAVQALLAAGADKHATNNVRRTMHQARCRCAFSCLLYRAIHVMAQHSMPGHGSVLASASVARLFLLCKG